MIANKEEIAALAKSFATNIKSGQLILLKGPIGVGKTFFVSKVLESLTNKERATSPTYSLMNIYKTENFNIVHMDAYRLKEITFLDLEEHKEDVIFIEYPTSDVEEYDHTLITIEYIEGSQDEREIRITNFKS